MAFINEFISNNDREKYEINTLWRKYHPGSQLNPDELDIEWTFDRHNDIYLKAMKSGREELSNQTTFVLAIKGVLYEVVANTLKGRLNIKNDPYIKIWELIYISPKPSEAERKTVLKYFKEALTAYGVSGVAYQASNTIVKFENF